MATQWTNRGAEWDKAPNDYRDPYWRNLVATVGGEVGLRGVGGHLALPAEAAERGRADRRAVAVVAVEDREHRARGIGRDGELAHARDRAQIADEAMGVDKVEPAPAKAMPAEAALT